MYKVVLKRDGELVSVMMADFGINEYTRVYSTHTPASNGFVFKLKRQAVAFAKACCRYKYIHDRVEIWRVKTETAREITYLQTLLSPYNIKKYNVNDYFLKKGESNRICGYLTGTFYTTGILLLKKCRKVRI